LNSQRSLLLGKLHWKRLASNVIVSEVDALVYVILSKAEKHVPYW